MGIFGGGTPKKVIVTDLNGPWAIGDMTFDVLCHLVEGHKLGPQFTYEQATFAMKQYRRGKMLYGDAIKEVMSAYNSLTLGKPAKEIREMISEYIKAGNIPLHSYHANFLRRLREAKRRVIGLTSSPEEITEPLRKHVLPMDKIVGTTHKEAEDGTFAKLSEPLATKDRKYVAASELKQTEKDVDWSDSVGIGDTTTDRGIFDHTDIKVALNPDTELFAWVEAVRARESGWLVVPYHDSLDGVVAALQSGNTHEDVRRREQALADSLAEKFGKKLAVEPTILLPIEYRHIIDAGKLLRAYAETLGWPDELCALFVERFAKPAYVINKDDEKNPDPRYDDPGRKAFTRLFDEILASVPEDVRRKVKASK